MVIDEVLPQYDVGRVDVVVVTGTRALLEYDMVELLREDRFIGALFAVRAIPDRMMRALRSRPRPAPTTSLRLADLPSEGEWVRLGEDPGREIVFGAAGRFWNGPIRWARTTPASFASFAQPGSARVVAGLAVLSYSEGRGRRWRRGGRRRPPVAADRQFRTEGGQSRGNCSQGTNPIVTG